MPLRVDPNVEPYFDVTFILGACVCCERCGRDAAYASDHPEYSDENYYDQAVVMHRDGWLLLPDWPGVLCPSCATEPPPGAAMPEA
jgi:hypothetical protein